MKDFSRLLLVFALLAAGTGLSRSQTTETFGTAPDGTILQWSVYTPTTPGPWSAVLLIHGGRFMGGTRADAGLIPVANDLANAGYLAISIDYRLAPPGMLPGQTSSGQKMEQYDDVMMAVRAARADARCNGLVVAVGGSAGGTHASWVALTKDPSSRVNVAVSLSGAFQFDDFTPDPNLSDFKSNVSNFCGVPNPPSETDMATLQTYSPTANLDESVSPLLLVNSAYDIMPFSQMADMTNALRALAVVNFETMTLPGGGHSWEIWTAAKSEALKFIADGLASALNPPPPLEAPSINVQPRNKAVLLGVPARFSVSASGGAPLLYQWHKNGVVIDGATNSAYTTPPATTSDNGALFSVVVSNSAGSVTSVNAKLRIK